MTGRMRAWLLIGLVFVAGIAVGVSATLFGIRQALLDPPEEGLAARHLMRQMTRSLDLDEKQQQRVGDILAGAREDLIEIGQQVEPQVVDVLERAQQEIRSELRPEQVADFDAEVARRVERLQRLRSRMAETGEDE